MASELCRGRIYILFKKVKFFLHFFLILHPCTHTNRLTLSVRLAPSLLLKMMVSGPPIEQMFFRRVPAETGTVDTAKSYTYTPNILIRAIVKSMLTGMECVNIQINWFDPKITNIS